MFKFQKQIVDLDFLSIIIKGLINAIAILFAFKITEIVIYTLGYTEITRLTLLFAYGNAMEISRSQRHATAEHATMKRRSTT